MTALGDPKAKHPIRKHAITALRNIGCVSLGDVQDIDNLVAKRKIGYKLAISIVVGMRDLGLPMKPQWRLEKCPCCGRDLTVQI